MKRISSFGAYPQLQQAEDREEQAPVHCSQWNIKIFTLGLFLPQTTLLASHIDSLGQSQSKNLPCQLLLQVMASSVKARGTQ